MPVKVVLHFIKTFEDIFMLLLINANPLINKTHHQIFTQPPDIDEQVATIRWGIFIRVLDQVGKNTPQKHLVSFNMFKAGYVVIDMEAGITRSEEHTSELQ